MVQKSEKTAVPVLIQGLFDRSRSRTVDTLYPNAENSIPKLDLTGRYDW